MVRCCCKKKTVFKCLVLFAFTSWIIISIYGGSQSTVAVITIGSKLHAIDKNVFLKFLKDIDAFSVDVDFLQQQKQTFDALLATNVSMGVFDKHISALSPESFQKNNIFCEVIFNYGKNLDRMLLTVVHMNCANVRLQLSVFHKRGEFYWIGSGGDHTQSTSWFGDVDRAIDEFNLTSLSGDVKVPSDVAKFIYDYKHSKFIECDRELAEVNRNNMGSEYRLDKRKEYEFLFGLKYIKRVIEGYRKNYWLAAGTLLGWYRDCGVIPFTTDVDLAMWSHEFEKKIKEHFLSNDDVKLAISLGLLKEGYELRLYSKTSKTFDLFLMYKENSTHQWNGYHTQKRFYRQWLPVFDETNLCSGELFNNKFIVPCNPASYLAAQYGVDNWKQPKKKKYFNTNSLKLHKEWSDKEWPYVIRRYNINSHKIDVNKTLSVLNALLSEEKHLVTLPIDNDEFEN